MTTTKDHTSLAPSGICDVDCHVHALLAKYRKIAAIWCIEDVQHLRPELTDGQAWEVLQQVRAIHDAECGISWTTLETVAEDLFGSLPESEEVATGDRLHYPKPLSRPPYLADGGWPGARSIGQGSRPLAKATAG